MREEEGVGGGQEPLLHLGSARGIGFKSLSGLTVFVSGFMQGRSGANRSAR